MIEKQKVEDHNNLQREGHSKAILNVDRASYQQYLLARNSKKNKEIIDNRLDSLESDINEIKNLLVKLLDK